ncbi:hypothetical protein PICMEDRAFT_40924, partial [Pichia membranifaciens NRRL Y-2026]
MVQQLSLTAQVASPRIERLLLTLETLTGNICSPMHQHSVILKPRYPFTPEPIPGKFIQIESYRIRMNRIWEKGFPKEFLNKDEKENEADVFGESITKPNPNVNSSIWTLQLTDIPAGGKNSVLIQNIYETTIYQTDDVIGYLDELGYMHEAEFWTDGVRFYYGNVIIELSRLYIKADEMVIDPVEDSETSKLSLLDPTGTCHVKAYVNVGALNDLESAAIGIKQLESLKKELSEIVELHIPDRTAMDSRINSR